MSSQIQAALIALLLPKIYVVMVRFFEELKNTEAQAPRAGFESLLFTAATMVIEEELGNEEVRKQAMLLCGNARVLLQNLPFLRRSPTVVHLLLQNENFGVRIDRIKVYILAGNAIKVNYNFHQPLLVSKQLDSSVTVFEWAHKFLELAVEKRLNGVDIYFPSYTDEEWEKVKEEFLETADKMVAEKMKDTGSTYIRAISDYPNGAIFFGKMTDEEAELFNS